MNSRRLMAAVFAAFLGTALVLPFYARAQESVTAEESLPPTLTPSAIGDDSAPQVFVLARVEEKLSEETRDVIGFEEKLGRYRMRLLRGTARGQVVEVEYSNLFLPSGEADLLPGDRVVLVEEATPDGMTYHVADRYRLPALAWALLIFIAAAVLFAGRRGLGSVFGLGLTVLVISYFVVPRLIAGADPFWTSVGAASSVAVAAIYLAHGFNRRTHVALAGTVLSLVLAGVLAQVFTFWAGLSGGGSDSALFLSGLGLGDFNLRGLLLGGIIIGVLGILDDVTTAQVAVVAELREANSSLGGWELYRRAMGVGREHIAAVVNTVFLAYAGAALPLFLLFTVDSRPLWVILNGEPVAEEAVRAFVGSLALIAAVPLTTLLAVWAFRKNK